MTQRPPGRNGVLIAVMLIAAVSIIVLLHRSSTDTEPRVIITRRETRRFVYREPLRPSNQTSPPRVAVCLAGGVRTMRLALPSLTTNFIEALQPHAAYRQVFVEVGLNDDCEANYNNAAVVQECKLQFRETVEWVTNPKVVADALGVATEVHVDEKLSCEHPFLRNHTCCVRDRRSLNDNGPGYMWGMAQYMRRRLCYDRIVKHERRTGVKFDLVAVTRPDMIFMEPVPPAEWFLSIQPRIFAMSKDDGWGDYVFMAPRSLSDEIDSTFNDIFADPCSQREINRGAAPESRLGPRLGERVANQRFPFQAFIVRSPNRADCWRFGNGVNDVGRYQDSAGALAPIYKVCQEKYPYRIPPV